MKELIIRLDGYNTVAHIYSVNDLYMVTLNKHITNIGGANLKQVMKNTKKAIKRRG